MSLRSSFRPSQPRNIAGSDLPAVLTCRERPNSQNTNETTSETACGYSGHTAVKGSECGRTLEHNYRRKLCPRYPRTRDHLIELWAPRDAANRGQTRRGNRAITSGNSGIASNCDVVSTVIPLQSSIERQIIRYEMWLLACWCASRGAFRLVWLLLVWFEMGKWGSNRIFKQKKTKGYLNNIQNDIVSNGTSKRKTPKSTSE